MRSLVRFDMEKKLKKSVCDRVYAYLKGDRCRQLFRREGWRCLLVGAAFDDSPFHHKFTWGGNGRHGNISEKTSLHISILISFINDKFF